MVGKREKSDADGRTFLEGVRRSELVIQAAVEIRAIIVSSEIGSSISYSRVPGW